MRRAAAPETVPARNLRRALYDSEPMELSWMSIEDLEREGA